LGASPVLPPHHHRHPRPFTEARSAARRIIGSSLDCKGFTKTARLGAWLGGFRPVALSFSTVMPLGTPRTSVSIPHTHTDL
jgi:hypothetical protein